MQLTEALKRIEEYFQGDDTALEHIKALKSLATSSQSSDDPPPQPPGGPF